MSTNPGRLKLLPSGFHGDRHLQTVAHAVLAWSDAFIETGSNVGTTLLHVARAYPHLPCLSCEPDPEARSHACQNTSAFPNVSIFAGDSQSFFASELRLKPAILTKKAIFWLDAHCYGFRWPLPDEINFISRHFPSAWILVDDCAVPGRPEFAFHAAPGESCNIPAICAAMAPSADYRIWHPVYREHTSPWHPLTGWCLVALGSAVKDANELLAQLPAGLISENHTGQPTDLGLRA